MRSLPQSAVVLQHPNAPVEFDPPMPRSEPPVTPLSVLYNKAYSAQAKAEAISDFQRDGDECCHRFAENLGIEALRILEDAFGEFWVLTQLQTIRADRLSAGTPTDPRRI
jgi:hypothetical protein